jgi:uncharacterized membrane protein YbhN (UPF0104 family)
VSLKILKSVIKIAVALTLIAVVLHPFDVRDVTSHFAKIDPATMLVAIAIALVVALLHTARWLAVIKANKTQLDFRTALQLVLIGHFFNQALPSSVGGDALRIWCAYRAGLSFSAAAGTVIIDRAFTLFSLLLLTAAGLPWLLEIITDPAARWGLTTVLCAGIAGFCAFLALTRLPPFMSRWRAMRALLSLAALGRTVTFSGRYAAHVILLSVLSFIGFSTIVFYLAAAMELDVTLGLCVLLVPPVILVSVLPVSIAGWGVREGAMVVALGFVDVPASAAFAVSVLFGLTLAAASLPGAALWWLGGYSVKNIAANVETLAAEKPSPPTPLPEGEGSTP